MDETKIPDIARMKFEVNSGYKITPEQVKQSLKKSYPEKEVYSVYQTDYRDRREIMRYFFARYCWKVIIICLAFYAGVVVNLEEELEFRDRLSSILYTSPKFVTIVLFDYNKETNLAEPIVFQKIKITKQINVVLTEDIKKRLK